MMKFDFKVLRNLFIVKTNKMYYHSDSDYFDNNLQLIVEVFRSW